MRLRMLAVNPYTHAKLPGLVEGCDSSVQKYGLWTDTFGAIFSEGSLLVHSCSNTGAFGMFIREWIVAAVLLAIPGGLAVALVLAGIWYWLQGQSLVRDPTQFLSLPVYYKLVNDNTAACSL